MYFTWDWDAAREWVRRLTALERELAIVGHGPEIRAALRLLARDFDRIAVPEHGRCVVDPARVETGAAYTAPG